MPYADPTSPTQLQVLMTYTAELELEVDRLRRRDEFLQHAAWDHVRQLMQFCKAADSTDATSPLRSIGEACGAFSELLRDLNEPSGYHPALDQVIAIAVRPLAEQV